MFFCTDGRFSTILKKVRLPMVSNDQCQANLRKTRLGNFFRLHESFVCAGGEEGIDSCRVTTSRAKSLQILLPLLAFQHPPSSSIISLFPDISLVRLLFSFLFPLPLCPSTPRLYRSLAHSRLSIHNGNFANLSHLVIRQILPLVKNRFTAMWGRTGLFAVINTNVKSDVQHRWFWKRRVLW